MLNEADAWKVLSISMGDVDGEIPENLQDLERETFLQIIAGEKPLDYFDTFVVEWYENGGAELTETVRESYQDTLE